MFCFIVCVFKVKREKLILNILLKFHSNDFKLKLLYFMFHILHLDHSQEATYSDISFILILIM